MLTLLVLTATVLLSAAPKSEAIVIYTGWERHALVGSDVRLSCSFFSWRWTSEDVTFSWSYRADGAKDSISIFHYTGGAAYVDNKGPFRDRLEFVGNPARRDGSILIRNLDFGDNGTFTCDAKNPPDIVGRPSSVRLLVFEKIPIQAGVITGAIIGVVLGLLILVVAIYYLMRFLVARRVFSLSVRSVWERLLPQARPEPLPGVDTHTYVQAHTLSKTLPKSPQVSDKPNMARKAKEKKDHSKDRQVLTFYHTCTHTCSSIKTESSPGFTCAFCFYCNASMQCYSNYGGGLGQQQASVLVDPAKQKVAASEKKKQESRREKK
ncbi:hypothetical protein NFI96_014404 [Prochilodus magdalenae]|nr:hypothetical protein NFI96_014404 [Prochilodus magdalenae]